MGAIFSLGLLLYYAAALRAPAGHSRELAKLLWLVYFALGLSATVIGVTDVLRPAFPPNYAAALFLTLCVLIGISGFLSFRTGTLMAVVTSTRGQGLIEGILIGTQLYAIAFFLPFALTSLTGDANENRLNLASKMELLGSFGIFNTLAGAASQLFGASLVMAFMRMAHPGSGGRVCVRAALLVLASLSYVVYILAYVGRDGVVYWMMTAAAVFIVFRRHLPAPLRARIVAFGALSGAVMLLPFIAITVARFADSDLGTGWSILEYFGQQINTFSDYASIDRPMTLGVANFPMFVGAACSAVGLDCENWDVIKELVFEQYLTQGKEPWLFGTYVSDFIGDFGFVGALILLALFALLCHRVSRGRQGGGPSTLARLLLVLFLFLVPYWGVFYFRFSIINGYIVVNLAFILFVWLLQGLWPHKTAKGSGLHLSAQVSDTRRRSQAERAVFDAWPRT